jgi:hypothetical protein
VMLGGVSMLIAAIALQWVPRDTASPPNNA